MRGISDRNQAKCFFNVHLSVMLFGVEGTDYSRGHGLHRLRVR